MISTSDMNPMFHLKHAWDNTHSMWGKATIVMFYVYIWYNIISGVLSLMFPSMMGMTCYMENETEYASDTISMAFNSAYLYGIGFFLYADRGGIRFWNVTMVFVFSMINLWWVWTWNNNMMSMGGAPSGCNDGANNQLMVLMIWIALAWVFSFLEHRVAGSGSRGDGPNESTPLNA
jgi:hypothetical protein